MKKFFVLILLLITAAGTFIPCCQSDNCCDEEITTQNGHEKNKAETACSPFFACATCPVSIEVARTIQIDHPLPEKRIYQEKIDVFYASAYVNTYWQPPRSC